jgi:hypothetical protein
MSMPATGFELDPPSPVQVDFIVRPRLCWQVQVEPSMRRSGIESLQLSRSLESARFTFSPYVDDGVTEHVRSHPFVTVLTEHIGGLEE